MLLQLPFTYGLLEYVRINVRVQELPSEPKRRLDDPAPKPLFWQRPLEVVESFDLEKNELIAAANTQIAEFDKETTQLFKQIPQGSLEMVVFHQTRATERKIDVENLNVLLRERLEKLRRMLEGGTFVAQGYRNPCNANNGPVDIPSEEWRIMEFDVNNAKLDFRYRWRLQLFSYLPDNIAVATILVSAEHKTGTGIENPQSCQSAPGA